MILFAFSYYEYTARQLRAVRSFKLGQFTNTRFENEELYALVEGPIAGDHWLSSPFAGDVGDEPKELRWVEFRSENGRGHLQWIDVF